jgi:hypothetical protein
LLRIPDDIEGNHCLRQSLSRRIGLSSNYTIVPAMS